MARIGVFGPMASGKSTVSRWFESWGARRVDGDALGWETLREGDVVAAIRDEFGAAVLAEDGSVDRAVLGPLVFGDPRAMDRLNAIVQPPLLRRVREALATPGVGHVLLDAALLTTWGLEPELDGVVDVRADEAARVARLQEARGWSGLEATARIRGQRLPPVRGAKRHWIVDNDGDLAALRRAAERVWSEIAALP